MTDYQPIQVSTPWRRTLLLIGCALVLVLGLVGATVIYLVHSLKQSQAAMKTDGPPR